MGLKGGGVHGRQHLVQRAGRFQPADVVGGEGLGQRVYRVQVLGLGPAQWWAPCQRVELGRQWRQGIEFFQFAVFGADGGAGITAKDRALESCDPAALVQVIFQRVAVL